MRSAVLTLLLPGFLAAAAAGQSLTSLMYVPLEHWSVPFLEHLISRGAIEDPTPMIRPWTVDAIVSALDEADTDRLTANEQRTLDGTLLALRPPDEEATLALEFQTGVRASTHARRDPVRQAGPGHILPTAEGQIALQAGPFALVAQRTIDFNLDYDPDFSGQRDVPVQGRAEYAYGTFRSRYATLEFGTLYRNWGPSLHFGLAVSPVPYSYDQFYALLGVPRYNLRTMVAQLDDMDDAAGVSSKRWWIVHRFTAQPVPALTLALWQTSLISGPNRSLDFAFLNPFRHNLDSRREQGGAPGVEDRTVNSGVGLDVDLRLRGFPHVSTSFLLDDIQCFLPAFLCTTSNDEPASYALTISLDGPVAGGTWSAFYTQVSNLANRTPNPAETVMIRGVGLGRNFSDYDQTTARATWVVAPGFLIGPEVTLLRQGEGDFRNSFPDIADFPTTSTIFDGTVERTWRGAVNASLALPFGISARADFGVHRIINAGHVSGATETEFVATFQARYRFGWSWSLR